MIGCPLLMGMAGSVTRGPFALRCTFFEQARALMCTKAVHLFNAGDWPILTLSRNCLFFGALTELARFLQRPVRAMH
jgi:hypothetical protein